MDTKVNMNMKYEAPLLIATFHPPPAVSYILNDPS